MLKTKNLLARAKGDKAELTLELDFHWKPIGLKSLIELHEERHLETAEKFKLGVRRISCWPGRVSYLVLNLWT